MKMGAIRKDTGVCLLAGLAMMFVLSLLNTQNLPDYYSYQELYINSDGYSWKYQAFLSVCKIFKFFDLSYDSFRNFNIIVASSIFYKITSTQIHLMTRLSFKSIFTLFLIFLISTMFFVEFMLVRLRAGYSIIIFLAFISIISREDLRTAKNFLLSIFFFSLSFFIHFETAVALLLFFAIPLFFYKLRFPGIHRYIILLIGGVFVWYIFYIISIYYSNTQRIAWASELNFFRFIVISPLALIFISIQFFYSKFSPYEFSHWESKFNLPNIFCVGYLSSALVICAFYLVGSLGNAGEAIVRIVTLYSVVAIWLLMKSRFNFSNIFSMYILSTNSIFFYNTIYLKL